MVKKRIFYILVDEIGAMWYNAYNQELYILVIGYPETYKEVKLMPWEDAVDMLYPNLSTEELKEELMDRIPD